MDIAEKPEVIEFNQKDLEKILLHRKLAMKINNATFDPAEPDKIVSVKLISADDPDFEGHFPDEPMYPGHCQIECIYLAFAVLILHTRGTVDGFPAILKTGNGTFRKPIVPGDIITIEAELIKSKMGIFVFNGKITNQHGEIVMELDGARGGLAKAKN